MKKLFLLFLLSFSFSSFAEQCPIPLGNIDIQINMEPLRYQYDYTSREMQSLHGHANPNLLGIFSGLKEITSQPSVSNLHDGYGKLLCAAAVSVKVNVLIKPIIYISKEAQQFSCTKQRTEQHEQLHYQFDVAAASKAKPYIHNLIIKYFGRPLNFNNDQELHYYIEKQNQLLANDVQKHFKDATSPLHEQIDSQENYKYESSFCSYQENVSISKLLKMQY